MRATTYIDGMVKQSIYPTPSRAGLARAQSLESVQMITYLQLLQVKRAATTYLRQLQAARTAAEATFAASEQGSVEALAAHDTLIDISNEIQRVELALAR